MRMPPKVFVKKKLIYFFYLLQPMLQFFMLMLLMATLSRCSPLSNSTTKEASVKALATTQNTASDNPNIIKQIQEDQITHNLKTLGVAETEIESEQEFNPNPIPMDPSLDAAKNRISAPILIRISKEQLEQFIDTGHLSIDLAQHIASKDKKAQKKIFAELNSIDPTKIDASSHLLLPESALLAEYAPLQFPIQLAYAITGENAGVLELHRDNTHLEPENDALLAFALRDAKQLAILLE